MITIDGLCRGRVGWRTTRSRRRVPGRSRRTHGCRRSCGTHRSAARSPRPACSRPGSAATDPRGDADDRGLLRGPGRSRGRRRVTLVTRRHGLARVDSVWNRPKEGDPNPDTQAPTTTSRPAHVPRSGGVANRTSSSSSAATAAASARSVTSIYCCTRRRSSSAEPDGVRSRAAGPEAVCGGRRTLEGRARPSRAHQRLLCHVLGVLERDEHAVAVHVQLRPVRLHQGGEGSGVVDRMAAGSASREDVAACPAARTPRRGPPGSGSVVMCVM